MAVSKNQINSETWLDRTANFSTRGSRTGVNLLGWEENEVLSPEHQREALVAAFNHIRDRLTNEDLTKDERKELALRQRELMEKIRAIRPGKKFSREFSNYICDVVKERVTRAEWRLFVQEAERRAARDAADFGEVE